MPTSYHTAGPSLDVLDSLSRGGSRTVAQLSDETGRSARSLRAALAALARSRCVGMHRGRSLGRGGTLPTKWWVLPAGRALLERRNRPPPAVPQHGGPFSTAYDVLDSLLAGAATIEGLVIDTGRTRRAIERALERAIGRGWVERDEQTVRLGGGRWAYVHRITRAGRVALARHSSAVVAGGDLAPEAGRGTRPRGGDTAPSAARRNRVEGT